MRDRVGQAIGPSGAWLTLTETANTPILSRDVGSSWMLRAAAAPSSFLTRGFARWVSRSIATATSARDPRETFGIWLPRDLDVFFAALTRDEAGGCRSFGPFRAPVTARGAEPWSLVRRAAAAKASARDRVLLAAWLAGAVPFGTTADGETLLYVLSDVGSPARGVVAAVTPKTLKKPRLIDRSLAHFAVRCAILDVVERTGMTDDADDALGRLPTPGVAEEEALRSAFDRAECLVDLLCGDDRLVRRAAKKLATRPLDAPPTDVRPRSTSRSLGGRLRTEERTTPLALGAMVEAFFRQDDHDFDALAESQLASGDPVVRDAARVLARSVGGARSRVSRELLHRREVARRAGRASASSPLLSTAASRDRTERIIEAIDEEASSTDPLTTTESRDEALVALAEIGDRSVLPDLLARARSGDISAVDMLGAIGDEATARDLAGLVGRGGSRVFDAAVVRAIGVLAPSLEGGGRVIGDVLRGLLAENPMTSWRDGISRAPLVRELTVALGLLRDAEAGPYLLDVLNGRSQEYRAITPAAAWALGRIAYLPALASLEQKLESKTDALSCEIVWAVGAIAAAHPGARAGAIAALERLVIGEPGAEVVRATALAKLRARTKEAPKPADLRRAIEAALWQPGFRRDETSRRRVWALRSLEELAVLHRPKVTRARRPEAETLGNFFLGHETVRYFTTRDDHRVRRAAEEAFAAWGIEIPERRRYFAFTLDELEARGGLDALHEALRDSQGVFKHNVATRLAATPHPSSVRPLAEATARLFAEPPWSTYEYDDAPSHLVAFVRALAYQNAREGNDVLIDGLRSSNLQVRAVVAENAPADDRFIPELMAMLGDPRSFLRARAERSLAALGVAHGSPSDVPPRTAEV